MSKSTWIKWAIGLAGATSFTAFVGVLNLSNEKESHSAATLSPTETNIQPVQELAHYNDPVQAEWVSTEKPWLEQEKIKASWDEDDRHEHHHDHDEDDEEEEDEEYDDDDHHEEGEWYVSSSRRPEGTGSVQQVQEVQRQKPVTRTRAS